MIKNAWCLAMCFSLSILWQNVANAELAVGKEGNFKDATEKASSELHDALGHVQFLLRDIDIHDVDSATKQRDEIVDRLQQAATEYNNALKFAGDRILNPTAAAATREESEDLQVFDNLKDLYGVKILSETAITTSVSNVIFSFLRKVKEANLKKLSENVNQQQIFLKYILQIQLFLNSITTVFRLG